MNYWPICSTGSCPRAPIPKPGLEITQYALLYYLLSTASASEPDACNHPVLPFVIPDLIRDPFKIRMQSITGFLPNSEFLFLQFNTQHPTSKIFLLIPYPFLKTSNTQHPTSKIFLLIPYPFSLIPFLKHPTFNIQNSLLCPPS